jgi:hypothetical protein
MSVSLQDWLANRWLVAHEPNEQEIADLFAVVDRDLKDAADRESSAACSTRTSAVAQDSGAQADGDRMW